MFSLWLDVRRQEQTLPFSLCVPSLEGECKELCVEENLSSLFFLDSFSVLSISFTPFPPFHLLNHYVGGA